MAAFALKNVVLEPDWMMQDRQVYLRVTDTDRRWPLLSPAGAASREARPQRRTSRELA